MASGRHLTGGPDGEREMAEGTAGERMIRKSVQRFSEKIMRRQ
jgi:hypothetical protein